MISKALLSIILEHEVHSMCVSDTYVYINRTDSISAGTMSIYGNFEYEINIHELVHKCKEWLYSQQLGLEFTYIGSHTWIRIFDNSTAIYNNKLVDVSEPEVIFAACQWILDNKDNT